MQIREIRILIADDHPQFLKSLRQIIGGGAGIRIVAECSNGTEALAKTLEARPDVAVLDIEMPGLDGIEVASSLLSERGVATRIILLTIHEDGSLLRRAREAGARGYVLKENAVLEIIPAIRAVAGGALFSGRLCSQFRAGGQK